MPTVREATYALLRELGLTTIFGNPGSTEEPFLKDFPADFRYVLALQEASAVGMADGFAQGTGRPALVNLHTAPGVGNAMGNIITASRNKTPLIITAGQQTRQMLLMEAFLSNVRATELPLPHVKWSYEPVRAQDVPAAFMRAYAEAVQAPAGPVFLSLPLDDWEAEAEGTATLRTVSKRSAPDPERLEQVAQAIRGSRSPALIMGAGIDRSGGWSAGVALAEQLGCAVYAAPIAERLGFPTSHRQYRGPLPFAIAPLSRALAEHDLVIVVGAEVFRYYPYVPGDYLSAGTRLWQLTDDPAEAARAPVGDSVIGDARLCLEGLSALLTDFQPPWKRVERPERPAASSAPPAPSSGLLSAAELFAAVAQVRPADALVVQEVPSSIPALMRNFAFDQPGSYFTMASGGLGFGLPAAVGLALAEAQSGRQRPVLAFIGDGSLHYSVQALYTAAQHNLKVIVVVPRNGEYTILKMFARQEDTPGVPGLDLPGLDAPMIARGYGVQAQRAETAEDVRAALSAALEHGGPTLIEVPIRPEAGKLMG
ncbi:benzoylformate decarboxylase (plasmid) [Deinococcus sp. KNUC1210]|uniref:benzoylformate decarboxylase n=1 Tax=Deinococcus sp. KNUC1210 TaxID=2917691 RepID=UPI001EF1015B|nr:benzoylformate decarboxylase [Deinococcus sp. KNUC1210]ULH17254.1 benzoylformate decarboxylase [Deinococcus sp. KNUC1210]